MADKYNGGFTAPATYGGKPESFINFSSPDIKAGEIRTRNASQEGSQLYGLAQAMKRLTTGFRSEDPTASRQAEYRNLQENVLAPIREHYASGAGGGGAFDRNVAGAIAASNEKLNALKEGRQHELQKLRQEQLPRLMELGLDPSFKPHLYEGQFNKNALPKQTVGNALEQSKTGQAIGNAFNAYDPLAAETIENAGELGLRGIEGGKNIGKALARNTVGRWAPKVEKSLNSMAKKFPKLKPAIDALLNVEENTRHPNIPLLRATKRAAETQEQYEENREIRKLAEKAKLPENLVKILEPKHAPMLKALLKRKRGREELGEIESADELEQLYNYWEKNPSKRAKIGDFFKELFGRGKKAKKE